ncbi:MAG: thioredoxin domain-containing protein [Candidatus Saccharimonadales bacterium]
MSKTAWIIFGSVIVLLFGGLIVWSRISSPPINVTGVGTNSVAVASKQNGQIADHTFGKTDSKVVLIEYGDFQCPSCGGAHPQIKALTEEYKDKILFIFRNFPLTTIHPNARVASAAAEAAGLQGKYWEMHNLVYESQDEWNTLTGAARTDKFVEYAVALGANKDQFLKDLAASAVNQKISFDQALAKKDSVDATPTFFLNGKKVDADVSGAIVQGNSAKLKALIDTALSTN